MAVKQEIEGEEEDFLFKQATFSELCSLGQVPNGETFRIGLLQQVLTCWLPFLSHSQRHQSTGDWSNIAKNTLLPLC